MDDDYPRNTRPVAPSRPGYPTSNSQDSFNNNDDIDIDIDNNESVDSDMQVNPSDDFGHERIIVGGSNADMILDPTDTINNNNNNDNDNLLYSESSSPDNHSDIPQQQQGPVEGVRRPASARVRKRDSQDNGNTRNGGGLGNMNTGPMAGGNRHFDDDEEDFIDGADFGQQDTEFDHQLHDLFNYISQYEPEHVELDPQLKPFIPEYIPCIGDIDPMIKIPPPTRIPTLDSLLSSSHKHEPFEQTTSLGLTVLDEPATTQSNAALLDLQIRAASKVASGSNSKEPAINAAQPRSIQLSFSTTDPKAINGQKSLSQFVQQVQDLHLHKPPDRVEYSRRMPDIEELMSPWPIEFEEALKRNDVKLPSADVELSLQDYVKLLCVLLDVPVYTTNHQNMSAAEREKEMLGGLKAKAAAKKSTSHIESLHVLFTLYSDFKNNQHFARLGNGEAVN